MAIIQEFRLPSSDGVHQLSGIRWLPDHGEPKAVLQLVHGISEYMGRYAPFAEFLTGYGWAVIGHDHLGHGHTAKGPEEYGWFGARDGWNCVVQDIRAVRLAATEHFQGLPYFLLGHSMGSFAVRDYLLRWPGTVDGVILSGTGQESPAAIAAGKAAAHLVSRLRGSRAQSRLVKSLSLDAYNRQFRPNRTGADWISRDETVVDAYMADPLCQFFPSAGMFYDMMGGLQRIASAQNLKHLDPNTPVYFFSGDQDPVGACGKGVQKVAGFFRQYGVRDVTVKLYPGGRHEMLNEINRAEVFEDTLVWLETQLKQVQTPVDAAPDAPAV